LQNLNGNELAKTPGLTADISLGFEDQMKDGSYIRAGIQYTYRGEFEQRVFNNPEVDNVDAYDLVNITMSYDDPDEIWGVDLIAFNLLDEDGVNSAMTDVFGVNETGFQLVPPRQLIARFRYNF
jgi:iron complex outermembrane receptor protein